MQRSFLVKIARRRPTGRAATACPARFARLPTKWFSRRRQISCRRANREDRGPTGYLVVRFIVHGNIKSLFHRSHVPEVVENPDRLRIRISGCFQLSCDARICGFLSHAFLGRWGSYQIGRDRAVAMGAM